VHPPFRGNGAEVAQRGASSIPLFSGTLLVLRSTRARGVPATQHRSPKWTCPSNQIQKLRVSDSAGDWGKPCHVYSTLISGAVASKRPAPSQKP
jgi:hypothetical protein